LRGIAARADIEAWIEAYEAAWRAPGTERLGELFTADARYRMSPYEPAAQGLAEIAELWERERESPDEEFAMRSEIVAVEGDTGVARVEVHYGRGTEYRDLWVIRLDADGRCREFEEWPYFPGQPSSSKGGSG
jgi:ketosteroid isomerase-like protein